MAATNKFNWGKFTLRVLVKSTPKKIFDAWTSQAGLEKWFLRLARFTRPDGVYRKPTERVRVNDTYEWMWSGYPDSVVEHGKVLSINGKNSFRFSFGKAGIVSVKIAKRGRHVMVELTQEKIPHYSKTGINFHVECKTGWMFYLVNMNSVLQGGIDLRNKDKKLSID